ncbi:metal ABC transporter substrate-binding protein [Phormidesmis priestleyi]
MWDGSSILYLISPTYLKSIRDAGVPVIFAETTINPALIEAVAKEAKVKVSDRELFSDGIGEPGTEGDTYPKMLIANTKSIVQGLGGRFTAFQLQTPSTRPSGLVPSR